MYQDDNEYIDEAQGVQVRHQEQDQRCLTGNRKRDVVRSSLHHERVLIEQAANRLSWENHWIPEIFILIKEFENLGTSLPHCGTFHRICPWADFNSPHRFFFSGVMNPSIRVHRARLTDCWRPPSSVVTVIVIVIVTGHCHCHCHCHCPLSLSGRALRHRLG